MPINIPQKTILNGSNLTYELPSSRVLFNNLNIAIQKGDRIGLVGRNGSGKSTLLKLFAGKLIPKTGETIQTGSIYYLPQVSSLNPVASKNSVLDWLSSVSDEWWTVTTLLESQFATELSLSGSICNLSGGELTKLWLALALSKQPDILLLDEPTNHLDLVALEQLNQALQRFEGAFVIVSHKPFFLDQVVNTIWELTSSAVKVYGGNYSFYRSQKEIEHQTALRTHELAKKELKQAKASAAKEQQRAAQSRQQGSKSAGSIPKIVAGALQRKAEVVAGVAKKKHEAAVEKATEKVSQSKMKTTKATHIQLSERSQKHRNLIDIQDANLKLGNRVLIENIQLHIGNGDRIAISGANGSGKSCLAKAILEFQKSPVVLDRNKIIGEIAGEIAGEITIASTMKLVYLDQSYELVNRDWTVLENMQHSNPDLDYQLIRQQLGHFLFFNDDVFKNASSLSGGELARLAIAMISITDIDLLILDEPTNNLDLETINQIIDGVNEFQGGLWVISHDIDFKSRIAITQAYKIKNFQLLPLINLPDKKEEYYQELLT